MSELNVSVLIKAIDQMTAPVRKMVRNFRASFKSLRGPLDDFKQSFGKMGGEAKKLGKKMAVTAGVVGYAFKRMFLDTASEFENYQTVLETIEGSSKKASKAMDWVSEFATKTPNELGEVVDAFVKLRAFGLDPTDGLLRTLGDTSAAMGKPLMQAVEAMADAITGENERLKEFGIKARTESGKVMFEYTANGKTMRKVADANNRAMVQSTLSAIWNEKFSGAMEKQSKTWKGMMSNIADQWTRFKIMVMKNGVFDWLKDKLSGFLEKINELSASGELTKIASQVGSNIVEAFNVLTAVMRDGVWPVMKLIGGGLKWLHGLFDSWKPVIGVIVAIMAGPLLLSMALATKAVIALGVAIMATPVGWIIAGVAAIAGAVYLIYKNWDGIVDYFSSLWGEIVGAFKTGFIDGLTKLLEYSPIGMLIKSAQKLKSLFFGESAQAVSQPAGALSRGPSGAAVAGVSTSAPAGRGQAGTARASLEVKVSDERVKVSRLSADSDMDVDVDAGQMMVMP